MNWILILLLFCGCNGCNCGCDKKERCKEARGCKMGCWEGREREDKCFEEKDKCREFPEKEKECERQSKNRRREESGCDCHSDERDSENMIPPAWRDYPRMPRNEKDTNECDCTK